MLPAGALDLVTVRERSFTATAANSISLAPYEYVTAVAYGLNAAESALAYLRIDTLISRGRSRQFMYFASSTKRVRRSCPSSYTPLTVFISTPRHPENATSDDHSRT